MDIVELLRGHDPKDYERILREHNIQDYRSILQAVEILKKEKETEVGRVVRLVPSSVEALTILSFSLYRRSTGHVRRTGFP